MTFSGHFQVTLNASFVEGQTIKKGSDYSFEVMPFSPLNGVNSVRFYVLFSYSVDRIQREYLHWTLQFSFCLHRIIRVMQQPGIILLYFIQLKWKKYRLRNFLKYLLREVTVKSRPNMPIPKVRPNKTLLFCFNSGWAEEVEEKRWCYGEHGVFGGMLFFFYFTPTTFSW